MARISILIPVYNADKYLTECLKSVANQTFIDFEVLIIDDGSTDRSGTICDEFAFQDSRFCVRHQKNSGGGVTRNRLLDWAARCHSKYIVWIDADDLVSPNYLKVLYEAIESNPQYNIVQCGFTSDKAAFENVNLDKSKKNEWSVCDTEKLLSEMQNGKHGIAFTVLWNKIYKKEVYKNARVTLTSDISGRMYDDINVLWKVYINSENCLILNHTLYYYRIVSTSIQHKKITKYNLEFIPIYCTLYAACKELKYENYCAFLGERILFFLGLNLGFNKDSYENYPEFYAQAKSIFHKLDKTIAFHFHRVDLKILYVLGSRFFILFRLYGLLYRNLQKVKARIIK